MRRLWLRVVIGLFAIFLVVMIGFVVWASNPLGPDAAALAALESGDGVIVEQQETGYTFRPEGTQPDTGLVFYPGGRVDYRAYAPALRQIAQQGYLVALVRMPLNLAVFGSGKAEDVINAYPDIQRWAVSGHSLGGAMAASYVYSHPNAAKGLVLWAAYPAGSNDLSSRSLDVVSVYGTQDQVAAQETVSAAAALLPADTRWVVIEGGNHAQFGSYGEQPGDGQASISPEVQWEQAAQATSELLAGMGR